MSVWALMLHNGHGNPYAVPSTPSSTSKGEIMTHTYESVLQHITGYLHDKLAGAPEVKEHAHFIQDLNVNSMQVFEIVEELEEMYAIVIPLELLYKQRIQTVAELVEEVMRLIEKR